MFLTTYFNYYMFLTTTWQFWNLIVMRIRIQRDKKLWWISYILMLLFWYGTRICIAFRSHGNQFYRFWYQKQTERLSVDRFEILRFSLYRFVVKHFETNKEGPSSDATELYILSIYLILSRYFTIWPILSTWSPRE